MSTEIEEFNVIQFEKTLTTLKDSQDNINACCKWCLENRTHHKKIVNSWLNVLKRVKIEQRLVLFYLANDVIQYSKRKHYDFVESWGTALQKATTLVRDDKVKNKIVRIFNIWQQRGVYNEEFISDLCGLISVVPTASKNDESHEFQSSCVINKIKQCSKLENETDTKLKVLKEHNPKIQIETDSLCASLKDRAHVDDVEKELETYVKHLEGYINALKAEIKCRISNISVLKQANTQLDKDKKDVKLVANAYKVFGNKVRQFQKKLEEHRISLASPVPSPDVNAPSPSPDCDIELPDDEPKASSADSYSNSLNFTAGYYNPVPPPTEPVTNFVTNGYTSFIGSNFSMEGLNASNLFGSSQSSSTAEPPASQVEAPTDSSFQYQGTGHMPLLPPPMPPFSANDSSYNAYNNGEKSSSYALPYNLAADPNNYPPYNSTAFSNSAISDYSFNSTSAAYPPNNTSEEYNPEQELDTWDTTDGSWSQPPLDTDTPESPPNFEKEGYIEGVEYHDNVAASGVADVDHRVLHTDIDIARGRKDVDHRNLISLTGSPGDNNCSANNQTSGWSGADQDYRRQPQTDQDYRIPPFNIEQLKLPPPPPPPQAINNKNISPRKQMQMVMQDNVESIDMDLSEDETDDQHQQHHGNNLKIVVGNSSKSSSSLKPPPPLPELLDDVDANSFLDDLNNDLNSAEFTSGLQRDLTEQGQMAFPPPAPAPLMNHWMNNSGGGGVGNNGKNYGFRGGLCQGGDNNNGRNNYRNVRGGGGRGHRGFRGGNNFRSRGFNRGGPMRGHKSRGRGKPG